MAFRIKNEGLILEPTSLDFELKGVLNPACVKVGDEVWMFYRAVSYAKVSSIGFCRIKNGKVIERGNKPLLSPEHDYERMGIEDPRITYSGGKYYLFYTAYDGINAQIAYAVSEKLPLFKKRGLLMPKLSYEEAGSLLKKNDLSIRYEAFEERYQLSLGDDVLLWEKDAVLFPEKIKGKYALLHRILPGIQIIYFDSFSQLRQRDFWVKYLKKIEGYVVVEPKYWYDSWNVGGGCPPLKTEHGWLLIYHTVEHASSGRIYHAAACLLDKNDPSKIIARLPDPLFSPKYNHEKDGVVADVVFPTGLILDDDRVTVYYGAADKVIAAKSIDLKDLLDTLLEYRDQETEISSSLAFGAPST